MPRKARFKPRQWLNADGKFPEGVTKGVLYCQLGPGAPVHDDQRLSLQTLAQWAKAEVPLEWD